MGIKKLQVLVFNILLVLCLVACQSANSNDDVSNRGSSEKSIATSAIETDVKIEDNDKINQIGKEAGNGAINRQVVEQQWRNYFGDRQGCAIYLDANKNQYDVYDLGMIDERFSPCSTFKVLSTLIILQNNIVTMEDSLVKWDGKTYGVEIWNKDMTMEEAFKKSCVWYYKTLLEKVDPAVIQESVNEIDYGNCDTKGDSDVTGQDDINHKLKGFWLQSSLLISPKEQVDVLEKIFTYRTNFNKEYIDYLKGLMKIEELEEGTIYGKTGSAYDKEGCSSAWFIGMYEKKEDTVYFAIKLNRSEGVEISTDQAKIIAKEICMLY